MESLNNLHILALEYRNGDLSDVEHIRQHVRELTFAQRQSLFVHHPPKFLLIVKASCKQFECLPHQNRFIAWNQYWLSKMITLVFVSNRRTSRPATFFQTSAHTHSGIDAADIVVNLWYGKIDRQHHLIMRNGKVNPLLSGIDFDSNIRE